MAWQCTGQLTCQLEAFCAAVPALSLLISLLHQADRLFISTKLRERLAEREHPLLVGASPRLVLPDTGLLYFAVDNTQSAQDPGVQAYKRKLQALCEANPCVSMPVPYNLIKLQDALQALARPGEGTEPALYQALRKSYGSSGQPLSYLRLPDVSKVYRACLGPGEGFAEAEFRSYLDFLHMQGVISHSNAAALDDLVIVNPFWLLKTLTAVIRDPKLHPREVDQRISPQAMRMLYDEGQSMNAGSKMKLADPVAHRHFRRGHHPLLLAGPGRPPPPAGAGPYAPGMHSACQQQAATLTVSGLQSGLAVIVALGSSHDKQSAGFLIPALLPAKTVKVQWSLLNPYCPLIGCVEQANNRPIPTGDCVTVHLASFLGNTLMNESSISAAEVLARGSLPAGLFEQVSSLPLSSCCQLMLLLASELMLPIDVADKRSTGHTGGWTVGALGAECQYTLQQTSGNTAICPGALGTLRCGAGAAVEHPHHPGQSACSERHWAAAAGRVSLLGSRSGWPDLLICTRSSVSSTKSLRCSFSRCSTPCWRLMATAPLSRCGACLFTLLASAIRLYPCAVGGCYPRPLPAPARSALRGPGHQGACRDAP